MSGGEDLQRDALIEVCSLDAIECGEEAAKHFAFDMGYTNLNHGSYGTYPIEVGNVLRHYQDRVEARPDAFVRYEYRTRLLDESRLAISQYLDVPAETCVLVPNVSTAFDTILRNLVFNSGDVIVYFSTIYGSFGNAIQYITETTPAQAECIEYVQPVSDEYVCNAFEAKLEEIQSKGKTPKIGVFDTITSLPAVRLPFERLTAICRSYSVLSCIDAAHGVGQLQIDLQRLNPDFYMSNCHKWLHVPRACAVLYVPVRNQHLLRATLPTGFSFVPLESSAKGDIIEIFAANFASVGTLDDTPYLCIPAAIAWRSKLRWQGRKGEEAIMNYTRHLAWEGGRIVARLLKTDVLENKEGTLGECSMTNVRLPILSASAPEQITQRIMKMMILDYQTAVTVVFYRGSHWVRLSAQVYLTQTDFERAGDYLREACESINENIHGLGLYVTLTWEIHNSKMYRIKIDACKG